MWENTGVDHGSRFLSIYSLIACIFWIERREGRNCMRLRSSISSVKRKEYCLSCNVVVRTRGDGCWCKELIGPDIVKCKNNTFYYYSYHYSCDQPVPFFKSSTNNTTPPILLFSSKVLSGLVHLPDKCCRLGTPGCPWGTCSEPSRLLQVQPGNHRASPRPHSRLWETSAGGIMIYRLTDPVLSRSIWVREMVFLRAGWKKHCYTIRISVIPRKMLNFFFFPFFSLCLAVSLLTLPYFF